MNNLAAVEKKLDGEELLKKENLYLLALTFVLGVLFNVLFYDKPLGVSYPIFVLAFYAVFLWSFKGTLSVSLSFEWILSIPVLALSFTYLLFSNELFRVLNFIAVPLLLLVQTVLLTKRNIYAWFNARFTYDLLYAAFARTFGYIDKPVKTLSRWTGQIIKPGKITVVSKVFVGLIISIPLVLMVVALLASADQVFAHFVNNIPDFLPDISLGEVVARIFITVIITVTVFSYIWSMLNRATPVPAGMTGEVQERKGIVDPVIVITVLFCINIIYVLFTLIQFTYLFASIHYALPENFTYAEYARRGFFELVAVTLINLTILLFNINLIKKQGSMVDQLARILNSLLIACTVVMLISAHLRMSLYEDTYGYTYLRVLTHAFMIFIFALLLAALYKIWNEKISLLKAYIVIAVAAYTVINYVNIDVVVARNNIERYHKSQKIDVAYLGGLSYDVVPLLAELVNDKNGEVAAQVKQNLGYKKENLEGKRDWQSFNLSGYRAEKVLEEVLED